MCTLAFIGLAADRKITLPKWYYQHVLHTRNFELCRVAVAQHGDALLYVQEHLRTLELCRVAVAQHGLALGAVPKPLRTLELCRVAVAQHGLALHYVPNELRTLELCRVAVAQNGLALGDVPIELRTSNFELCRVAVAQHGDALAYVPEHLCTLELCRVAVAQHGLALQHVPNELRTDEMVVIALWSNPSAIDFVQRKFEHYLERWYESYQKDEQRQILSVAWQQVSVVLASFRATLHHRFQEAILQPDVLPVIMSFCGPCRIYPWLPFSSRPSCLVTTRFLDTAFAIDHLL